VCCWFRERRVDQRLDVGARQRLANVKRHVNTL